jgi:beta-xylosidase
MKSRRYVSILLAVMLVFGMLGSPASLALAEEPVSGLDIVHEDANSLQVYNLHDVRGNLTLPVVGKNGSSITWVSDQPGIITSTGEVNRPAYGSGDVQVNLTATITKESAAQSKLFTATVKELPKPADYEGYLFPYFTGEGTSNGEQIYFALSQGNDPLKYQVLNDGKPVLTSNLGEKGLRDPFIIRSPEGDKFYLLATDLKIYGNGDWDRAQRNGSRSLMVWESTDLIHWSEQRMVEVAPPEAGNTWAPEAFYDETTGEYVVFWASKLYADTTHTGSTYLKMMYAKTRDFYTFTQPQVYMDYGDHTLDTTMIEHEGRIHRISKAANIIHEAGNSIFDPSFQMIKAGVETGLLQRGEGPTIFKSNTENKWYLFVDEYGLRGYVPLETTDLNSGSWKVSENYAFPGRPRHGTVLPITKAEYDAIHGRYFSDAVSGVTLDRTQVTLTIGEAQRLTATVAPSSAANKQVSWASDNPGVATVSSDGQVIAISAGTAMVTATTADGGYTASAEIKVKEVAQAGLLLWYKFDETSGTTVIDHSGNENNGAYINTPAFGTGVAGSSFRMAGGSSTSRSPYVKIPNGILNRADSITVSAFVKWSGGANNQWLFGLGQDNTKYLFLSPKGGTAIKTAITTGSWQSEQGFSPSFAMPENTWKHVAIVLNSTEKNASVYVDGVKVGSNSNVTIKPSDLYDASRDYTGYIGRSFYSPDPYFGGEVDDFRIYGSALSEGAIAALAGNSTVILGAEVDEQKASAIIQNEGSKILLLLKPGSDMTKLAPRFTLTEGARMEPASGSVQSFTSPVHYVVTGADGGTKTWTVEAKLMRSPALPGLYADPHAAVFGNKFYIYPTTDGFPGWSGTQFKAFSSDDLVNWTDHGVIFDVPQDTVWAEGRAWAPAMAEKNGKYYFYYSADTNIGVAVSDSPTGPFVDPLGKPLIPAGQYSGQMIDPMAFTDDDGQSYLYFGNGSGYVVKLKDDMISLDGPAVNITPSGFREGAFVFKRDGKYYFMWSENDTRDENYRVAYAIGNSPMGPFTKQSIVLQKDLSLGIKGPGHHSVVQVPGKDEYYIVYHRFSIPGGDGTHREVSIDKMLFNEDGTIRAIAPTLEGIDPVVIPGPVADDSLLLHYDMKQVEGAKVKDRTGRFDGTWVNPQNGDWIHGSKGGVISLPGGRTDVSHIEIPEGVLNGLTDVTVSALVNWQGGSSAEWLYALGQSDTRYLYYTPKYNADSTARFGIATNGWRNEVSARSATQAAGDWKLVTTVMSGTNGTLTLYVDGVEVATAATNGFTLNDIRRTGGPSGYIGRSFYSADPYFGGAIADFRIYGRALKAEEVGALQTEASARDLEGLMLDYAADQLDYSDFIGSNVSKDTIISNLSLPTDGGYGTSIAWKSSDVSVISDTGVVTRPPSSGSNRSVVLTATISASTGAVTRSFTVTVLRSLDDAALVAQDANELKVYNIQDVRGNLTLPRAGKNGSVITWTSAQPGMITPTGEVTRPAHGSGDAQVQLTAVLSMNGVTQTKHFTALVRELPESQPYEGYVFTYFTGEGYSNGEQMYFALSQGNNPLKWQELNGGNPVFTSELGEKGLRDPFIIRSPEGDRFYLIATDLKMYGSGDWDRAQRQGSRSIMVWESTDLIHWSEQRMVQVAPSSAGNTWAPEIHYDPTTGEYVVFWASKLYDNAEHSGSSHQRMMYAKTRDFYTFTEPAVYIDRGYSIIDTTMIEHNGKLYRFTKDERGNSASSPNGKFVFQESGASIFDPAFTMIKEGIGKGSIRQGEGPTVFKSNTEDKWYLFIDEFGGRGYVPFETTNLDSGEWTMSSSYNLPARPRHGTVLPITAAEYNRLLANIPQIIQPNEVVLSGSASVQEGAAFDIVYGLNGASEGILAQDVTVTFDPEKVELVSVQSARDGVQIVEQKLQDNRVRVLLVHMGAGANGEALRLTFKAKETEATVTTVIAAIDITVGMGSGEELRLDGASHQVVIQNGGLPGDFNGDGELGVGDMALLAMAYGQNENSPGWETAQRYDLNGDGRIDIVDLAQMAQRIFDFEQ